MKTSFKNLGYCLLILLGCQKDESSDSNLKPSSSVWINEQWYNHDAINYDQCLEDLNGGEKNGSFPVLFLGSLTLRYVNNDHSALGGAKLDSIRLSPVQGFQIALIDGFNHYPYDSKIYYKDGTTKTYRVYCIHGFGQSFVVNTYLTEKSHLSATHPAKLVDWIKVSTITALNVARNSTINVTMYKVNYDNVYKERVDYKANNKLTNAAPFPHKAS